MYPETGWHRPTEFWNAAPFLLCCLWRPWAAKLPPRGTIITEYEEMREIEVPPLLSVRGLLTILQQSAGCWAPKNLVEAEADMMAGLAFWQNWRVLYKQNIARNLALAGGEIISGGGRQSNYVTVRTKAIEQNQIDLPVSSPLPGPRSYVTTPALLLTIALSSSNIGPVDDALVAEQQIPYSLSLTTS
ncbi:MAG: hypothetical protein LBJ38_01030 [Oscillospiraceae bacterium]|nr:hypothetical protein [Oscillospiraceae bacterium]